VNKNNNPKETNSTLSPCKQVPQITTGNKNNTFQPLQNEYNQRDLNNTATNIYLKPLEACALLRIALSTLYNWVHERRIPYHKHGRLLLFRKDLLIEWSNKQAVAPIEINALTRRRG
jgi:excisionase family DNA binding protein